MIIITIVLHTFSTLPVRQLNLILLKWWILLNLIPLKCFYLLYYALTLYCPACFLNSRTSLYQALVLAASVAALLPVTTPAGAEGSSGLMWNFPSTYWYWENGRNFFRYSDLYVLMGKNCGGYLIDDYIMLTQSKNNCTGKVYNYKWHFLLSWDSYY